MLKRNPLGTGCVHTFDTRSLQSSKGNMLRRVSLCRILIIILYGLSGLLPLIGFGISYVKHRLRIRGERDHQKHIEYIDNELRCVRSWPNGKWLPADTILGH